MKCRHVHRTRHDGSFRLVRARFVTRSGRHAAPPDVPPHLAAAAAASAAAASAAALALFLGGQLHHPRWFTPRRDQRCHHRNDHDVRSFADARSRARFPRLGGAVLAVVDVGRCRRASPASDPLLELAEAQSAHQGTQTHHRSGLGGRFGLRRDGVEVYSPSKNGGRARATTKGAPGGAKGPLVEGAGAREAGTGMPKSPPSSSSSSSSPKRLPLGADAGAGAGTGIKEAPRRPRRSEGDVRFGTRGVARTRRGTGSAEGAGAAGFEGTGRPANSRQDPSTTVGQRGRSRRARGAQTRVSASAPRADSSSGPKRSSSTEVRGAHASRSSIADAAAAFWSTRRARKRRYRKRTWRPRASGVPRARPRVLAWCLARETDLTSLDVTSRTVPPPLATRGHALEFGTRARVTATHRRADTPG